VVLKVGWRHDEAAHEADGTMERRVVDTTSQTDRPEWEELTAQALAVPLSYRPQPGVAVYHVGVDDLVVMIAERDLIGPMLDLVTAVLTLGDHL
jgi:hypothetical protein